MYNYDEKDLDEAGYECSGIVSSYIQYDDLSVPGMSQFILESLSNVLLNFIPEGRIEQTKDEIVSCLAKESDWNGVLDILDRAKTEVTTKDICLLSTKKVLEKILSRIREGKSSRSDYPEIKDTVELENRILENLKTLDDILGV